ncbi:MAG: hypothetical protein KDH94_00955 [Coxiellaceae bacterium]|nr:hypothetical protein [Coxiellaceae bacterium]
MDKDLKRSVRWLESLPAVTKVVLGFSEACRHKYSPGSLRFKMDADGGIKINGYSGKGVTDIFVKIDPITERENIKSAIAEKFMVS